MVLRVTGAYLTAQTALKVEKIEQTGTKDMNTMNQIGDFQKIGQANMETTLQFFGEFGKSWQAIVAELTDYTKRSVEEGVAATEKLNSVRSIEQAFEIQTEYAKSSYDSYVQQMTKIGGMYSEMAQEVYRPVEKLMK